MQGLPGVPETATCCPRTAASAKTTATEADPMPVSSPPSWGALPVARRRRLVTVLGTLVQRTRKEKADDA